MLERYERALKIACIGLAVLMLYQFVRLAVRRDPLANLNMPALPSLPPAAESNSTAQAGSGRNRTNSVASRDAASTGAVAIPRPETGGRGLRPGLPLNMPMADMNPMSGAGPGRRGPPLPPDVQARIDRITDSEILAPIVRPLPMALLGIAGPFVFLRAPNGQTGMVKEGDGLGELKLLSIGINRVLVEQDGQKKELTIFSGFGGETLLPKEKDNEKESPK